jgi:hypothetical protein
MTTNDSVTVEFRALRQAFYEHRGAGTIEFDVLSLPTPLLIPPANPPVLKPQVVQGYLFPSRMVVRVGQYPLGTRLQWTLLQDLPADKDVQIVGWEGDCSGTAPCTLDISDTHPQPMIGYAKFEYWIAPPINRSRATPTAAMIRTGIRFPGAPSFVPSPRG